MPSSPTPSPSLEGRKQFEAQWYGLKVAFSEITRDSCSVVSAGNPVEIDMKTKYKVKGIGSEQTIASKIKVFMSADGRQITKVEDKWNADDLPEGGFKKVSDILNPMKWVYWYAGWAYWASVKLLWDTRLWDVRLPALHQVTSSTHVVHTHANLLLFHRPCAT